MSMLTEKDIHKFAEAVSNDFINSDIPLNDSIRKLAEAREMNDEQIGRVCEAANNITFNKLFKNHDKTANDRIVEFDVADRRNVLNAMMKSAAVTSDAAFTKTAAYELRPLDDHRYYERRGQEEPVNTVKTASFELRPPRKTNKHADIRTVEKTIDYLRHEKIGHDMAYFDKVEDLTKNFKRVYNELPFSTFEKNAAALWGSEAEPVLADLRILLKKEAVAYDYGKIAKTAGYIDDSDPAFQLMKEAVTLNRTRHRISTAVAKLESSL